MVSVSADRSTSSRKSMSRGSISGRNLRHGEYLVFSSLDHPDSRRFPAFPQAMQRALASVDPRLPFSSFKTISQVRGAALQQQRYEAILFSVFAGLAILLAALGVYGLIAQSVAQRTREMGIRLALGATVNGIIRTAALSGVALSVAGVVCG